MAYITYYNQQVGGGGIGVQKVYVGSRFQRGHGFGSFLGGLLRGAIPYLKSGARYLGKEVFKQGLNVIDDIENRGSSFKNAVKERSKESIKNLKRKASEKVGDLMLGSGYKRGNKKKKTQSKKGSIKRRKKPIKRLNNKKKKSKNKKQNKKRKQNIKNIVDIFGAK